MENSLVNIIVMYTISKERTNMRSRLHELLLQKFNLQKENQLNESSYSIEHNDTEQVETTVNQIIIQLQNEGYTFGNDDFIDMYYAAHLKNATYKETELDKIVRHHIYPNFWNIILWH